MKSPIRGFLTSFRVQARIQGDLTGFRVQVPPRTPMHVPDLHLFIAILRSAGKVAGHSCAGSSPSRTPTLCARSGAARLATDPLRRRRTPTLYLVTTVLTGDVSCAERPLLARCCRVALSSSRQMRMLVRQDEAVGREYPLRFQCRVVWLPLGREGGRRPGPLPPRP